jgi:hypothetical protein
MPNLLTTGFLLTCAGFLSFVPVFAFLYSLNGERAADAFYHVPSFRMSFNHSLSTLHTAQQAAMVTGLQAAWLPLLSVAVMLTGIGLIVLATGTSPIVAVAIVVGFCGALAIYLGYARYYRAHSAEIDQILDRAYSTELTYPPSSGQMQHGPFRDKSSRSHCLFGAALLALAVLLGVMQ